MKEFKGTKGKWKTYDFKGVGSCIDIIRDCNNDELERQIAQVYSMQETNCKTPHNEELKANAQLIASAPEMLEVLIQFKSLIEESNGITGFNLNNTETSWDSLVEVENLYKVIEKALGE